MKFGLLGSLLVSDDDNRVRTISSPRQRVLLATLLLKANTVVSVDELAEQVWDGAPPPGHRATLQSYVMRLRRVLGDLIATRLHTRSPGYLLEIRDEEFDIRRFTRHYADGAAAHAAGDWESVGDSLRQALREWRGDALVDILSDSLQRAEVPHLNEMRSQALELRIEADLSRGRHRDIVAELQQLVVEFPLRERLWHSLLLALDRSGQRAEALAAFQRVRRLMIDQLGVAPGPDLQRLHAHILRQEPEDTPVARPIEVVDAPVARQHPAGAAVAPSLLPADIADFTGRTTEIERLERVLHRCAPASTDNATAVPILGIAGQAGVGKTTLAVHLAHRSREAYPGGQLFVNLHGMRDRPTTRAEVLARFLRALGVPGADIPESVEQRAELYRQRLADRRVLVVLDDAADAAQVMPLLPGDPGCAVIITSRAPLTGVAGGVHTVLDVLADHEAVELLGRTAGPDRVADDPESTEELVRLCGRLPLAMRIAGAKLAAKPHWSVADLTGRLSDQRRRLDELTFGGLEVRAGLALSYDSLPPATRMLVRRLGLLDAPDFAPWVGAALLNIPVSDAEDIMDALADARLLQAADRDRTGQRRYHFHDLVQVYARERAEAEESAQAREAALGRAIGAWLALLDRAHDRLVGGRPIQPRGAATRLLLEPTLVDELTTAPLSWWPTERDNIIAAIAQTSALGWHDTCCELTIQAMVLFETRSDYDGWRATHELALSAARRSSNKNFEAALLTGLGALASTRHQYQAAAAVLGLAINLYEEMSRVQPGHVVALRNLAYLDRLHGRSDRALRRYGQANELLLALGNPDPVLQAAVLRSIGSLHLERDQPAAALPYLHRAETITRAAGSVRATTMVLYRLGELYLVQGELDRADKVFTEALENVRTHVHNVRGEADALYGLGLVRLRQGEDVEALSLLQEALVIARDIDERLVEARVLLAMAEHHKTRHNPNLAITVLIDAFTVLRRLRAPLWLARTTKALSDIYRSIGDIENASRWRNPPCVGTRAG